MDGERFEAPTPDGPLHGTRWGAGSGGPGVLLLHGGPGLTEDYLATLAGELVPGYDVATFRQRGNAPSPVGGPYSVTGHVADVAAVLDALGWERCWLVGHSWGGHLAFHCAVALPDRLLGVLAVDPLAAVGDGGAAVFEAEMLRRTPQEVRERAEELDRRAMAGEGTEEDALESFRMVWPAYFADPDDVPPVPGGLRLSVDAYSQTWQDLVERLPALERSLGQVAVPLTVLAGEGSPMPH
ncbi:MAG TPA: alpha/beta hydrolase, partial [Nocardioides sp.]|nr:alpha/beta hydrolase [Nocardioides sp.]